MRKHQELLEQLEAESTAKARLTLELHKAEGECGHGRFLDSLNDIHICFHIFISL